MHRYTQEQTNWIVNNIYLYTCLDDLRGAFNNKFNSTVPKLAFESMLLRYKIKTNYVNSSRLPTLWTEDKLDWLRNNKDKYQDRRKLIKDFNEQFNCSITLRNLSFCSKYYNIKFNKKVYTEQLHYPGRNYKHNPIGTEMNCSTKVLVKVTDKYKSIDGKDNTYKNYKRKHVYLYEQYNNCEVLNTERVIFLDGNHKNFSKENLYKISLKAQLLLASIVNHLKLNTYSYLLILWCEHRALLNEYLDEKNVTQFLRNEVHK